MHMACKTKLYFMIQEIKAKAKQLTYFGMIQNYDNF
jgi:hypothetical protein